MHTKTTTDDHRIGATGLCCGRDARKSTFAEFLVPFDFRLLQQYLPGRRHTRLSDQKADAVAGECQVTLGIGGNRRSTGED